MKKRILVIFGSLLACIALAFIVAGNILSTSGPESVARFEIPDGAVLLESKQEWTEFGGGFSLWVYSLSDLPLDAIYSHCGDSGYTKGKYQESGVNFAHVDKFMLSDERSCYLLQQGDDGVELSQLVGERLIIYTQK